MRALILTALLLASCGDHTKVRIHETTREDIDARAGMPSWAWAEWHDFGYEVLCDIYIMPPAAYGPAPCYEAVLRHEKRHCYEFDFHPYSREYFDPDIVAACPQSSWQREGAKP